MSTERERALFEEWFTRNDDEAMSAAAVRRNREGEYTLIQARCDWEVWQAAREGLDLTRPLQSKGKG